MNVCIRYLTSVCLQHRGGSPEPLGILGKVYIVFRMEIPIFIHSFPIMPFHKTTLPLTINSHIISKNHNLT